MKATSSSSAEGIDFVRLTVSGAGRMLDSDFNNTRITVLKNVKSSQVEKISCLTGTAMYVLYMVTMKIAFSIDYVCLFYNLYILSLLDFNHLY